ncbi:MAG: hypothetical protein ACTSX6_04820 [Candidatus Heimdallarchaeaceae archaeon]
MAYKYRYIGGTGGIATFWVDGESYTVAKDHPSLSDEVTLERELTKEELTRIGVLEKAEEDTKKKSKRGDK